MSMAGIKPHHRIALGVSGGPDSVALCVLAAGWKSDGLDRADAVCSSSGFIDGLLGIVVDHRLRPESGEEAKCVRDRVSKMGIRCEVAQCDWLDGRPKRGRLQEAARDMRYRILQSICVKHRIGVLLIAHHADDQAELFILRLSRGSGVLGLAGMAFVSQIFPTKLHCPEEDSANDGILLVRPLLDFSKDNMYNVCRGVRQEWVEDPTNQNPLFARNRIRMSLRSLSSCTFKSEMQAIISACRLTRSYVDHICDKLISEAVTIMEHGYAIIDIEKLNPLKVEDLCLSRFLTSILQFISQRQRPVRGSISQSLLDYIRNIPCKTALTAAGCYLCAAPGSKGTKVLVCCSMDSPLPSKTEASHPYKGNLCPPTEIEQIIENAKVYTERMVPNASEVHFLQAKSSQDVLCEAKALKLINESTSRSILSLQMEESNNFRLKEEEKPVNELKYESKSAATSLIPLKPGESCYYMNRFLISWKLYDNVSAKATDCHQDAGEGSCDYTCAVDCGSSAAVRNMVDADWLYLANISKCQVQYATEKNIVASTGKTNHYARTAPRSDYVQVSAQQALQALKLIPVSARRGLPVLVDSQGLILNIPSIHFKCCPHVQVLIEFKPRVPLGGGYSSYI
ncbi:hypothetical protein QJS10_CPA06g00677 [Acorus calamus]|uniref:tRNA(Ile)-lysidine synthetase n=1 Tax=Acorus calamus TaxID=4465 RepID=A0AAV9EN14_ACOCL|nr:hypothetical protein QJS10_CPA06g00677 [Acorus calamus]